MDVVSLCPLRVSSLIWRPSSGGHALTVICKGTFDLRPSELSLAQQQEDPSEEDNFWDDDPNRSVRAPSDLVPFKARADVVLVGQAFAPNRTPVRSLLARLAVSGVEKTVEVCGERTWTPEAGLREGHPFTSMQLRYERAASGPDNPVGVRVDPRVGGSLPNLQVPEVANGRGPDATTPIGFGPIAASWPTRRARLGEYAASFAQHRWASDVLPEDIDAAFFNAAPPDQQPEHIEPGARLLLENLDPRYARLVTKVPRQRPRAFVDRNGGLEEIQLACDTLWIDTDRGLCTLTWRGQIGVHGPRDEGRVVFLLEQPAHPLTWPEIQQQCASAPPAVERAPLPSMDESDTAVHDISMFRGTPLDPALPFRQSRSAPKAAPQAPIPRPPPWLEAPAPAISSPSMMMNETLPPGALRVDLSMLRDEEPRPAIPHAAPEFMQQPPRPSMPSAPHREIPAPHREIPVPPPSMGSSVFVPPPLAIVAPPSPAVLPPLPQPLPPQPMPPQQMPPPLPSVSASPRAATAAEIVELVGYDPTTPDRVHLHLPWQELIARLQPPAKEVEYDNDPIEESDEVKDRRDIFGVLAEGEPTSLDELDARLGAATSPSGVFEPPLLLLRGELELTFTELETLKATLAAVAPFTTGPDKKLKDAFEATSEALKSPYIQASGRALEGLTSRLRDAFPQVAASLPAGYLDQQVERILVEQRHHQKRIILGKPWIRALLGPRGGASVPTYVPEELAAKLPLYARFTAKLIVELNLQQDQYESHPCALLCLALARVTPSRSSLRGRPSSA